eukprot:3585990-Heterocapsa_arctica.AAC.1
MYSSSCCGLSLNYIVQAQFKLSRHAHQSDAILGLCLAASQHMALQLQAITRVMYCRAAAVVA